MNRDQSLPVPSPLVEGTHAPPVDRSALTPLLQQQVKALVTDLRGRIEHEPAVAGPLQAEHSQAVSAERTGLSFFDWTEDRITNMAVGWVLALVFVRFCEDNDLTQCCMRTTSAS